MITRKLFFTTFVGLLTLIVALPVAAQIDTFQIAYGDIVSNGVPTAGAGNIEVGGAQDAYTFQGVSGEGAIFDALTGNAGLFRWSLTAPNGTVLFSGLYVDRELTLPQTGAYTLTVSGGSATVTGVYSFQLLLTPAPQLFTISFGDTVSNGVPAAGAGNLEAPGAEDVYSFDAVAGQGAIFDVLSGSNVLIGWRLEAPDSTVLFDSILGDRQLVLDQTGTYTLVLRGNAIDRFGLYSFRLLEVPAPQSFVIGFGDTVSDGVPAAGAGNLEASGAIDHYTFDGVTGQGAIFDVLVGDTVTFRWMLEAPDGTVVFGAFFIDQQVTLPQTGTYTLTVSGLTITSFGVYSFQLINIAAPPQTFAIGFGDTVSDGVPAAGAGNLEAPGAIDRYTFDGTAGQEAIFDVLVGDTVTFRWRLEAPDGSVVFDAFYVDQQAILPQTGTYTLTVSGLQITSFGVYSFQLREVPATQTFAISFGDTVSDSVPAAGAGNLEVAGAIDIYTFDGTAGQETIFDVLLGNPAQFRWKLEAPDGAVVFDSFLIDQQPLLAQTGTYTLTVQGTNVDDFGVYSFSLLDEFVLAFWVQPPASFLAGEQITVELQTLNPTTLTAIAISGLNVELLLVDDSTGNIVPGELWSGVTSSGVVSINVTIIVEGTYRLRTNASGVDPVDSASFQVTGISGIGQAFLPPVQPEETQPAPSGG